MQGKPTWCGEQKKNNNNKTVVVTIQGQLKQQEQNQMTNN